MHERCEQADQRSERDHEGRDTDGEPEQSVVVEPAVRPSGLQVSGVTTERLFVARLASVQGDVAALHLEPAEENGGVRISLDVGVGVVLAVYRDPLTWADAGRDPHQEAKRLADRAFEGHCLVRQPAVQEHRRAHEADARHAKTDQKTQNDDPQHHVSLADLPTGR